MAEGVRDEARRRSAAQPTCQGSTEGSADLARDQEVLTSILPRKAPRSLADVVHRRDTEVNGLMQKSAALSGVMPYPPKAVPTMTVSLTTPRHQLIDKCPVQVSLRRLAEPVAGVLLGMQKEENCAGWANRQEEISKRRWKPKPYWRSRQDKRKGSQLRSE